MQDLKGKWALVTGASSGFGIDFARLLAERGANLALVARRAAPMETLGAELSAQYGVKTHVEAVDLARAGVGAEVKAKLDAAGVAVDVLINNAGFGLFGPFLDRPLSETIAMLQLDILSLTELTHVFAGDMVRRGGGEILLISSIGGYQATPLYAAYSAAKAYVLLFGEALHDELKEKNVTVTVLSPGIAATGFLAAAGQKATPYQRLVMMKSRDVARIGLDALKRRRASIVPGFVNAATAWSNRLAPRSLQRRLAYQMMKN